jgi:hypothetical protein
MDNTEKELIAALRQAVSSGDEEGLQKHTYDLDSHLMEVGHFTPDLFQEFVQIIALPEFRAMEGSFALLKIVEFGFDYLNDEQKSALLETFEKFYESFADFTTCFLISEIIAESYGGQRAVETFRRLKTSKTDMPRSMIPHGLEYLVKKTNEPEIARQAFNELLQMKSDVSEDVRNEVDTSMAQLKKHGWPRSS